MDIGYGYRIWKFGTLRAKGGCTIQTDRGLQDSLIPLMFGGFLPSEEASDLDNFFYKRGDPSKSPFREEKCARKPPVRFIWEVLRAYFAR